MIEVLVIKNKTYLIREKKVFLNRPGLFLKNIPKWQM